MCLRGGQRVVYTSPIKALSNQKYRELAEEFSDVGLMTGDVTIAPNASCLVMTTEILRSMLYRGSEAMREVAWVVFDEVHYLRDAERGVVWEESIVMAPRAARFVFLSATVPNAREFADWVAKVHQQPCHIVYTDFRPTPLQHYVFPAGGDGLYLAVDEGGTFREDNFQKAVNAVGDAAAAAASAGGRDGGGRGKKRKGGRRDGGGAGGSDEASDIFKIVRMIVERQYDPVIVFSFNKANCEALARQASPLDPSSGSQPDKTLFKTVTTSQVKTRDKEQKDTNLDWFTRFNMVKLDMNSDDEKVLVEGIFRNAMDSLSDSDKKLPMVSAILPLLRRGIGIHHSGLLPIVKEVIEILFQEGLIKCLFATETFSIGLNMPAKTVVFADLRKWDGGRFRYISGGEYIQMSGRAGRRGIDDRGICILMLDEKMEPAVAKAMLKGTADPLNSAFHLSYSMILNQMRSEESDPERMLRSSFRQFQAERALPDLKRRVEELEEQRSAFAIAQEDMVEEYLSLSRQLEKLRRSIRKVTSAPEQALRFLNPGRLARVVCSAPLLPPAGAREAARSEAPRRHRWAAEDLAWGVIISFERASARGLDAGEEDGQAEEPSTSEISYVVDVLLPCTKDDAASAAVRREVVRPCRNGEVGEPMVAVIPLSQVDCLSSVRIHVPKNLIAREAREHVQKTLEEVQRRFPDGLQLLDPEEDMQVESSSYRKAVRRLETVESTLASHPLAKEDDLDERLEAFTTKEEISQQIKNLTREVKDTYHLILKDELKSRRRVLRRLGYVNLEEVVQLKGRVACELTTADELTMTELIFGGVFQDLPPESAAALASCFVWQEKVANAPRPREELEQPLRQLRDVARRVGKVQEECKMVLDVEEYVAGFRQDIMEIVYQWCRGAKFADILRLSDIFEGSLIRALRRLEELLRQLVAACASIGEAGLEDKFRTSIELMKRDIVFAASLYL
eukprot:SM000255S08784  [mRNA]  locus=s255:18675:24924:- [translate_table: standard]